MQPVHTMVLQILFSMQERKSSPCFGFFVRRYLKRHHHNIRSQMWDSSFHTSPGLKSCIMWGLPLYYGTLDTFLYARKEIFPLLCLFCAKKILCRSGIIITLGAKCGTPLSVLPQGDFWELLPSFSSLLQKYCALARVCSSVSGFLVDKGLLEVAIKNKEGGGA